METQGLASNWALARAELAQAGWSASRIALDAGAVPLALTDDPRGAACEALATADALKRMRGHRALRGPVRFVLAPLLDTPPDVAALGEALTAGRSAWREAGLRRDEPHRTLALLALLAVDADLDASAMGRLQRDWRRVKRAAFWHAGPALLPLLALAGTMRRGAGDAVLAEADTAQGLGLRGDKGTRLRAGAYLAMREEPGAARAMVRLQKALRAAGCKRAAGDVDLLGAAILSELDPEALAADTARLAAALKGAKHRPSLRERTALSLLVQDRSRGETGALSGALSAIAAIAAQQAAIAAVTAAGAAGAAASG